MKFENNRDIQKKYCHIWEILEIYTHVYLYKTNVCVCERDTR